jgi:hypothetical protein
MKYTEALTQDQLVFERWLLYLCIFTTSLHKATDDFAAKLFLKVPWHSLMSICLLAFSGALVHRLTQIPGETYLLATGESD